MLYMKFKTLQVIILIKMKNDNIRMYAERIVRGNRDKTAADVAVKVLKVFYWLVAVAAILSCLTMIIGCLVTMDTYKTPETADQQALYNECRNYFIIMVIAVFSIVASFFLLRFKLCIPFAIAGGVDCILIFSTFYSVSNANEFMQGPSRNFWIMAIPSAILAALAIAIAVLLFITYRVKIPVAYEKIVDELYRAATKGGEVVVSPEEFEEIMDNYKGEEIFPTDRPLKKSQRRRKEKQDSKMAERTNSEENDE